MTGNYSAGGVNKNDNRPQYVRNQKGHSLTKAILLGWTTLYILPIYWAVSPNHYYHA